MQNKVNLIIINPPSKPNEVATIILAGESLPARNISGAESIEQARDILFREITGFSALRGWVQFKLVDVVSTMEGVKVYFSCLLNSDFPIQNPYKRSDINNKNKDDNDNSAIAKSIRIRY